MIAQGDLSVDHLISHVVRPEEADDAYQRIVAGPQGWDGRLLRLGLTPAGKRTQRSAATTGAG